MSKPPPAPANSTLSLFSNSEINVNAGFNNTRTLPQATDVDGDTIYYFIQGLSEFYHTPTTNTNTTYNFYSISNDDYGSHSAVFKA